MRGYSATNTASGRATAGWLGLSFILWLICFRGFVSGHLSLQSDAIGYYQHIKFFIDNMVAGVYPFWDPGINGGVPNEFFLRRMGSFNPFFLIPVVLRWCGLPHLVAYTTYLASYYFLGALGFYFLCRGLVRRPVAAYAGFLIFLFSSLGTRQFDSYIVLVSVPLIWFFAFMVDYFRRPRTPQFAGDDILPDEFGHHLYPVVLCGDLRFVFAVLLHSVSAFVLDKVEGRSGLRVAPQSGDVGLCAFVGGGLDPGGDDLSERPRRRVCHAAARLHGRVDACFGGGQTNSDRMGHAGGIGLHQRLHGFAPLQVCYHLLSGFCLPDVSDGNVCPLEPEVSLAGAVGRIFVLFECPRAITPL